MLGGEGGDTSQRKERECPIGELVETEGKLELYFLTAYYNVLCSLTLPPTSHTFVCSAGWSLGRQVSAVAH